MLDNDEDNTLRDTPFDPCLRSASPQLAEIIDAAIAETEQYKAAGQLRTRRRKAVDQAAFEATVAAIIINVADYHLSGKPAGVAVARGHPATREKSRYRSEIVGKTFPEILDALASPEVRLIKQTIGDKRKGKTTVIRAAPRLVSLIERAKLTRNDIGSSPPVEVILLKAETGSWAKEAAKDRVRGH